VVQFFEMDIPDSLGDEVLRQDRPAKGGRFPVLRPVLWMAAGGILTILVLAIVAATFLASGTAIREQATMKSLSTGIVGFHKEYGHFPVQPKDSGAAESEVVPLQGAMLAAILGRNPELNPRQFVFYDPPQAKDGKAGLAQTEDLSYKMLDSNGTAYFVVLDLDGDGLTNNPNPQAGALRQIRAKVLVYSAGPDHNPATWDDNAVSW
jgi:hypothetical protein